MFANTRNTEDENHTANFGNNENDEIDVSNFCNRSTSSSHTGSERAFDSESCYNQSQEGHMMVSTMNDHASQSSNEFTSLYTVKKSWNYKAVLNDRGYPRIKISAMGRGKKSKSKKSRNDFPHYENDNYSPKENNSLKTRLKLSSGKKSTSKKSLKRRKKLSVSTMSNSYNGLSSTNSVVSNDSNYENNLVPTQPNNTDTGVSEKQNHYLDDRERTEYAPQYLELKPSVKFKCCLCGTDHFSSMALLQEHMARCDGHPSASVTANSLLEFSSSVYESGRPSTGRNLKIKRKVLLCSSCGTYYQHYNLYVHMRDIHNKEICLFCRNTFSKAEQLWDHLIVSHSLSPIRYSNAVQVRDAFKSFFLTCCSCNTIFSDQDKFSEHECNSNVEHTEEREFLTGCKSENDQVSQNIVDNVDELNQFSDQHSIANSEDEIRPISDACDAGEEPAPSGDAVNITDVSKEHAVAAEEDNSEETVFQNAQIEESSSLPESFSPINFEKEENTRVENSNEQSASENQDLELRKPLSSPSEETDTNVYRDVNVPHADKESVDRSDELESLTIPCTNEDQTQNSSESAITNEAAVVTNEEKTNNWVESDNETGNQVEAPSHNEVVPPNAEPIETPQQPLAMALMLDESVVSLSAQTLIKECVRTSCDSCLYCNNAILITVDGAQLAAHLRSEHRYMPTKPEDSPEQVVQKIEEAMNDLKTVFMNASLASEYTKFDGTFACLQCSFSTTLFKELCHHKRKLHHKVIFLCIMCKCNFFYYSQLLCHLCPGQYSPEVQNTLNYHCCFCNQDDIPSAFRLMVHLRKIHQACDICLTQYKDQSELFSHMIKQHKMNHLCYKCNLAYRSRDGINEHLFWKHGTESALCKRCLQKKWPHAYHFCIPASTYTCDECSRIFTKAVALTVHRRAHNGDFPFPCIDCEQKFISKKLLTVHRYDVHDVKPKFVKVEPKNDESNEKPTDQEKVENSKNDDSVDGKERRKKKRKKEKTDIEKPPLDELPPLNLSSESEEDSDEEEVRKSSVAESSSLPPCEPESKDGETESKTDGEIESKTDGEIESKTDSIPSEDSTIKSLPNSLLDPEIPPSNVDERTKSDDTEALPSTDNTLEELAKSKDGDAEGSDAHGAIDSTTADEPTKEDSNDIKSPTTTEKETSDPIVPVVIPETATTTAPDINAAELSPAPAIEEKNSDSREELPEISIERIRNCLMIEHSYCIPDSIFHSEGVDAETSLENSAQKSSPKLCAKSRDKTSGCKSVTPRKRKRPLKRESSSSDSSSDSDSSSSSCGSNCSCNQKSNSNCSSSSSGSECSTTPDKKHVKNSAKETRKGSGVNDERNESKIEEDSLLNLRESDLDTDIETSDEDFYDKYPSIIPRVEEKPELPTLPVPTMPSTRPISSLPKKQSSSSRKSRKQRRTPKITISLGSQNEKPSVMANISVNMKRFDDPSLQNISTYKPSALKDNRPGIHLCKTNPTLSYATLSNDISNDLYLSGNNISASDDGSDRRSKRERIKNKFYGYSSSDNNSGNESVRPPTKKRSTPKRPPKVSIKQPFVGIRARKPAVVTPKHPSQSVSAPSTVAVAHPSLPPHLYRMPNYIMQQQQQLQQQQLQRQQQYQQSSSSSDDSDSDNLVINEPSLNERKAINRPHFRFPIYPPVEPSNWQRASISEPTPGTTGPSGPVNEKLYCYCQCPYDEVSEMIGCDGANCKYEWFHFECVGIMVPPKGAWYCPQCKNRETVPQFM